MRLSLANLGAVAAACLMTALIGAIALTGRWPVDAPRTHLETGGILSFPADRVARIEIAAGGSRTLLSRAPDGGWLVNDAPARAATADHIAAALRILAVSAPLRVLAAGKSVADAPAEFGLDPPRLQLALAEPAGSPQRIGFGELTPAENAQYVRIVGRPELYLLPHYVGDEWQLVRDMAMRARGLLLPVSIARIWAIEIVRGGVLRRFERDSAGLWFHHFPHANPGLVHHADPKLALLIAAQLDLLDRLPIASAAAPHPDAAAMAAAGLAHPATILLLYSRYSAGPVARIEFGDTAADRSGRWVHLRQNDSLVTVPAASEKPLAALFRLAGTSS